MPNENDLLAALDDLEKSASIRKGGDALQNAPHDGGFATQGTNIQKQAKMKKAIKALMKSGMSEAEATKVILKGFGSSSDDDSSSEEPIDKAMDDDDSMSADDDSGEGEDEGSDDMSSEVPPMAKSTGASQLAAATQGTLRKALTDENPNAGAAMDAAPILGQLIDSIDRLAKKSSGPSKKDLGALRKSIVNIENTQSNFNTKLAKALSIIAGEVQSTRAIVDKIASEPVVGNRANTLQKSQLAEPHFHDGNQAKIGGDGGVGEPSPLTGVNYYEIQKALTELCMNNKADLMDITKFENSKGNLSLLPPNVVKLLEQRLCSAS